MALIKHAPVISILVALVSLLFIFYIGKDVGKGSDAAGRGMAQGYFVIIYGGLFAIYIVLILISFIWYRGSSTELTSLKMIYHTALYLPLAAIALYLLGQGAEVIESNTKQLKSHNKWHETSKDVQFKSILGISFEYASKSRGTFNTSYYEDIELIEDENRIVILGRYQDKRYFRGQIRKIEDQIDNITKQLGDPCELEPLTNHPFNLPESHQVLSFRNDSMCSMDYTYHIDFSKYQLSNSARANESYFVMNTTNNSIVWEILIDNGNVLLGPLKLNTSPKKITHWHETIKIDN